jgi:hypothetical protein
MPKIEQNLQERANIWKTQMPIPPLPIFKSIFHPKLGMIF